MVQNKDDFLKYYKSFSPFEKFEEIDGTFYPRDISEPDIRFIPLAEPHAIISDLYHNPQDWYYIRELIEEFMYQSFSSYYGGMYFASFTLSTSCLELILKYELIRVGKIPPSELDKPSCNLSWSISQVRKINLEKYGDKFKIVKDIRNGMYHFNPKKLNEALMLIQNEMILPDTEVVFAFLDNDNTIMFPSTDLPWSISQFTNNREWSKIAYYVYSLIYDITKELYGEDQFVKHIEEGLEDHERVKNMVEKETR
ncbi:hypothetical protein [Methanocalculus sp. MC3]